jgi:hypothetical protein
VRTSGRFMTVSELQCYCTIRAEYDTGNYTTASGIGASAGVPSIQWPRGKVSFELRHVRTSLIISVGAWRLLGPQFPCLG